jgi:predicted metal-binding membrane protein
MTNTIGAEWCARLGERSDRTFLAIAALLFCTSAAVTVQQCVAMADMPGMDMPGGWQMSMMWMRMPEQSWPGAAVAFVAMWTSMMVAMMLPSLVPMLRRYRAVTGQGNGRRLDALTALVAAGYFSVWSVAGAIVYVPGIALATLLMQWPAASRMAPLATGLLIVVVGAVQFSAAKARQLAGCARVHRVAAGGAGAWRHGVRLGLLCCRCCSGFTVLLLVCGVMDLIVMSAVTAAISAERLAPANAGVARATGAIVIVAGLVSTVRAVGLV